MEHIKNNRKNRWFYPLCRGRFRNSQIRFIFDGIAVNAALILTTGPFLSGYIVLLKGSDFLAGLLNNSGTWASLISISFFLLYNRLDRPKRLLITLFLLSRISICSIIFLPLFIKDKNLILSCMTALVVVGNLLWGFYSAGANVWLARILPRETRADYVFTRMFWLRISFTLTTIVMGVLLDWFRKSYTGFLIVFLTSLVFSIIDLVILSGIQEPDAEEIPRSGASFNDFLEPWIHPEYRHFLVFSLLFYLATSLANSFTPLYYIRYLKLSYSAISAINVLTYLAMIFCTNFWGRIQRQQGSIYVLWITAIFIGSEFIFDSFLTTRTVFLLALAPLLSGIGYSGFNTTTFNYRYEIMPERNQVIYEGWFGAMMGLGVLAGPVLGSWLMDQLPRFQNRLYQFSQYQLLYLIAFCCTMLVILFFFRDSIRERLGAPKNNRNPGSSIPG